MNDLQQQRQQQLQAAEGEEEEERVVSSLLPLDIICGPIASYLDRCSFNNLGLCCRSVKSKLDELPLNEIQWPDTCRLFLHSYARCFAFSNDGCWLCCGDMQGNITLWNRKYGKSSVVWRPNNNNNNNNDANEESTTTNPPKRISV